MNQAAFKLGDKVIFKRSTGWHQEGTVIMLMDENNSVIVEWKDTSGLRVGKIVSTMKQ